MQLPPVHIKDVIGEKKLHFYAPPLYPVIAVSPEAIIKRSSSTNQFLGKVFQLHARQCPAPAFQKKESEKRMSVGWSVGNWTRSLALLPLLVAGTAFASDSHLKSLTDLVRAANDRFKDVSVAVAEGYAPIPCASGADGGAMGIHYVNAKLISTDALDIKHPQAVMYEPKPDGKLELIAVEYITLKGPASLGGQLFNFNGAPNRYGLDPFYELHVWAWKANPRGSHADMNPTVTCEYAPAK